MKNSLDHLVQEITDRETMEIGLRGIFEPSYFESSPYLKEKLRFYEHLESKYGVQAVGGSNTGSILLRQEQKKVERMIYPNPTLRLLYRLSKVLFSDRKRFAYEKSVQSNLKNLQKKVSDSGFKISGKRIEHMIRHGRKESMIPVSYYVNEKEKMDFLLKFVKDAAGNYNLEQYQGRYQNLALNNEIRTCSFNHEGSPDVTARQAHNLLAGRAVRVGEGAGERHWIQLDLNDKDAEGNYKIKVFPADYGFNLSKCLTNLGVQETLDYISKLKLVEAIENGDRVDVAKGQNRLIGIEANPQRRQLDIYEKGVLKIENAVDKNAKVVSTELTNTEMKIVKTAKVKGITH
ncbi:hypothetical protein [Pedobacter nutrimenti]|uniref:hypothetical protein n=1 Tax=Pedobacter nutrimenti TaxID=1241337 RepID=UPI00292D9A5F|nr:hypothetical protein [Pedobacter nutrimenti]